MRKIRDCTFLPQQNYFGGLTPENFFQNFSMRAIDFSHKITPKGSMSKNFPTRTYLTLPPPFKALEMEIDKLGLEMEVLNVQKEVFTKFLDQNNGKHQEENNLKKYYDSFFC